MRFAEGYEYEGPYTDLVQTKFSKVSLAGVWTTPYTYDDAKMKLQNVLPKTIKPATTFVTVVGQIRNFDAIEKCNISFRGTFTKSG